MIKIIERKNEYNDLFETKKKKTTKKKQVYCLVYSTNVAEKHMAQRIYSIN